MSAIETGVIEVLKAGAGDEKIEISSDPETASKQVSDLMSKGYSLFISHDGDDLKVDSLDKEKMEFVMSQTKEVRVPASQAKITAVPPISGG